MLAKQRGIFHTMVDRKNRGLPIEEEYLMLVEHNPVITLGKHADTGNVLFTEEMLRERGVEIFRIERGGDVTYHSPGQLVVYPIIDLENHHLGVKDYVYLLEEAVIRCIAEYGVKGERVSGASGVWIDAGTPGERKICALGVKCSRFITMHGLALNVNTDLSGFSLINPCGFIGKGVTSLALELSRPCEMDAVKDTIIKNFKILLNKNKCK
ncbi:MAG: lipoyl(octanoyl) transferase LipB [Muribaculum sp.]|nr:lipoyl(octanoyl) transferase LipB [Muribaculum sp.]